MLFPRRPLPMIDYEMAGGVGIVTINRPQVRNAIDAAVSAGIETALDRLEANESAYVGVLCAQGEVFSAGVDMDAVATGQIDGIVTERGGLGGLTQRQRTKPLIAAVDGPAVSGGFELVMACDLVVAARGVVFALPEVKRALVPTGGGLFRAPLLLGSKVGLELLLTGDPLSADRAYQLGMVNQLVEPGHARQAALALAQRIAANGPVAVAETLRAVRRVTAAQEAVCWSATAQAADRVSQSADFAEAADAFVNKRPAVWRGQ